MRLAGQGDLDAFDQLVRRHQRAAMRVAVAVAGETRAADAAQEGFVRAFRSLDTFDTNRPFRPWLLHTVANAAKNELRTMDRHARLEMRATMLGTADDVDEDPAVVRERNERLIEALRSLSADDREIIALRWFEELSEQELADALSVRRGTVKSRLSRAMARLRAELAREEVGSA